MKLGQARQRGTSAVTDTPSQQMASDAEVEDETIEDMTLLEKLDHQVNRRSTIGTVHALDLTGPVSPVRLNRPDPLSREDDDFE